MGTDIKIDNELDVKGFVCPRPMVMTMNILKKMESGQTLKLIANDSSTKHSIPALCERAGYKLIEETDEGGEVTFIIQK
ncbi:sulfurtransferase TusA [bacterium BMS3Abin07]|nr:sulfurtransferase TusA [bacterium BMS3Abin07]GBE31654.1 sulfurtransferase TusA [bacterium BMS3Bbin05]HDL19654.1 sulfurtransferase TusA family protein [Nitrospirota bacterium]HDO22118.1 sulfurtransferase TusA family protein [Nitrospirota bacterium]HDZ89021.1 sulfurtransferase TusA family protein [Nitrospirota bacterium]